MENGQGIIRSCCVNTRCRFIGEIGILLSLGNGNWIFCVFGYIGIYWLIDESWYWYMKWYYCLSFNYYCYFDVIYKMEWIMGDVKMGLSKCLIMVWVFEVVIYGTNYINARLVNVNARLVFESGLFFWFFGNLFFLIFSFFNWSEMGMVGKCFKPSTTNETFTFFLAILYVHRRRR